MFLRGNQLFVENTVKSHKRVMIITVAIVILANLAILGLYLAGKTSSGQGLNSILQLIIASAVIIAAMYTLTKKCPEKPLTPYLLMTLIGLILLLTNIQRSDCQEIFADLYLLMAVSLLYLDFWLCLYNCVLVLVIHTIFVVITGLALPFNEMSVRYLNFIWTGIAITFASVLATRMLHLSIEKEELARSLMANLQQVAKGVADQSGTLRQSAQELLTAANSAGEATHQVGASVEGMARAATEEALHATRTAAAVKQMSQALLEAGGEVQTISEQSGRFSNIVQQSQQAMQRQLEVMHASQEAQQSVASVVSELNEKSAAITEILDMITDITEQTNLLALNAAIEAARAGEAGRGFAVVADEVRKLAEESREAAQDIARLVQEIQEENRKSVQQIEAASATYVQQEQVVLQTGAAFQEIQTGARNIDVSIQQVSAVLEEVVASIDEVVGEVDGISASTQETAASTEEINALSEEQSRAVNNVLELAGQLNQAAEMLEGLVKNLQ